MWLMRPSVFSCELLASRIRDVYVDQQAFPVWPEHEAQELDACMNPDLFSIPTIYATPRSV